MHRSIGCHISHLLQQFQKSLQLFHQRLLCSIISFFTAFHILFYTVPQKSLWIQHPDLSQFLGSTSHHRRPEHSGKGDILKRIVTHLQIIQHSNDFQSREISGSGSAVHRNPLGSQYLSEGFRPSICTSQQNYNIPILHRPVFPGFFVHNFFSANHSLNPLGNSQSLQLLRILISRLFLQLFPVLLHQKYLGFYKFPRSSCRKVSSRIERCVLVIGDSTQILSHDLPENEIHTLQHLCPASEVFVQIYSLFLSILYRIAFIFLHKQLRSGQTESVYTLFHISYHKDVLPLVYPSGYCCSQKLLNQITVLIFVHQHFVVFLRKLYGSLRHLHLSVLLFHQDLQCKMLHICEIQNIFFTFSLTEPLSKLPCKFHQHLQRLSAAFEHIQDFFFCALEIFLSQLPEDFLFLLTQLLYPLFLLLICLRHLLSA